MANRATPEQMRQVLELVDTYKKAGILFVPVPVLNEKDHTDLVMKAAARIRLLEQEQGGGSKA